MDSRLFRRELKVAASLALGLLALFWFSSSSLGPRKASPRTPLEGHEHKVTAAARAKPAVAPRGGLPLAPSTMNLVDSDAYRAYLLSLPPGPVEDFQNAIRVEERRHAARKRYVVAVAAAEDGAAGCARDVRLALTAVRRELMTTGNLHPASSLEMRLQAVRERQLAVWPPGAWRDELRIQLREWQPTPDQMARVAQSSECLPR